MSDNYLKQLVLSICVCVLCSLSVYCDDYACSDENACYCKLNNESYIDISKVVPKDKHYVSTTFEQLTYYFFPCQDFKFDYKDLNITGNITSDECKAGSSLCLYNAKNGTLINLSTSSNFKFSGGYPKSLVASTKTTNGVTTSSILLVCTPDVQESYFEFKRHLVDQNELLLFSQHSCLKYDVIRGLSGGSKLLIVATVLFCTYLLGGAVSLHCLRGARGKEMIPNIDFWSDLPGLVRDGFIFLVSGCNPIAVSTAETYDRI